MSVQDKYLSQSRIAVALPMCSPKQAEIIADIAEAMAKQDACCKQEICGESVVAPILDWLTERYCLSCGAKDRDCSCGEARPPLLSLHCISPDAQDGAIEATYAAYDAAFVLRAAHGLETPKDRREVLILACRAAMAELKKWATANNTENT